MEKMKAYKGFKDNNNPLISIPEDFFKEFLPKIDTLEEMKFILYLFWRLEKKEGAIRFLLESELLEDREIIESFIESKQTFDQFSRHLIDQALLRGVILEAKFESNDRSDRIYFLNSAKGRAAVEAIQLGRWKPTIDQSIPTEIFEKPKNIFQLYEFNIGALTPMIAEALGEAEETYPLHWIEDAIRIAVERNKRNWRYAEAILKRWQTEGRDVKKEKSNHQRDSEKDRRRYVEGEFSDSIEH